MKGTGEFMIIVGSPVPFMHHDSDSPWIPDPELDHPQRNAVKMSIAALFTET